MAHWTTMRLIVLTRPHNNRRHQRPMAFNAPTNGLGALEISLLFCYSLTFNGQNGVDRRFWNQTRLYSFLFFFMYVQNLWQGQKAVLTILEFEFVDIFYSKLQLVSTFSIWSKFCVENWLFCCDLSCKWVTCRSGCKWFWKSALHI